MVIDMPKKRTFEEVKAAFEARGYELLETEYINNKTKMKYRCPKHPNKTLEIKYNSLQQGQGCPYCARTAKPTYEEVKAEFEERGYELLETMYINSSTKMRYRCLKHKDEKLYIRLNDLRGGHGCPHCGYEKTAETRGLEFSLIKQEFEKRGYELLETEFVNTSQKLRYRCPKHPDKELSILFHSFKNGRGCPYCARVGKPSFTEVKKEFEARGYELLETTYINSQTKMRYRCPHHPDKELSIRYYSLKDGHGCPYCAGKGSYTFEEVKNAFSKRGYELLEAKYKDNKTKMRYQCPFHQDKKISITFKDFLNGHGCPYCGKIETAKKNRLPFHIIKRAFEERGYILLETKYINSSTPMRYRCPYHPKKELKITYNAVQQGQGCPYCGGTAKLEYEYVKQEFEKRGYELLETEFVNSSTKLKYSCPKHPNEELYITYNSLRSGSGCPLCGLEKIKGNNHYKWKGGITSLSTYLREKINNWKFEELKKYNFKCAVTGENDGDLHIHHSKPFYVIRDEVLASLNLEVKPTIGDYTQEELDNIVKALLKRHDEVAGIPLKKSIHELFHSIYGYQTTMEQLIEFKSRYLSGEFEGKEVKEQQLSLII